MAVVGIAEVLVRPSFKGFQTEVGQAVDESTPETGSASPGAKVAGRIAKGMKWAAAGTVGAAGALLGVSLTKGFGRLQAIENAQAKLTGLGHDGNTVAAIMQDANAAVKGTAFGLDEAATASAAAVAAGVQPGEELEGVLRLMGDAATIAGVDFMSMASIFNKVKASGKLQGDTILQLADMGIPILQLLANELGVTTEEVSKMASRGEIDFEMFRSAMEAGMGGAALKSGETLQGAFANSMAAIGRFGANLMSGVYPLLTQFFNGFIVWMGPVEEMGKAIGEGLSNALQTFVSILGSSGETINQFFTWIRESAPWVGVLAAALGGAVGAVLLFTGAIKTWAIAVDLLRIAKTALLGVLQFVWTSILTNPVGLLVVALGALVAAAVYAYQNFETFRAVVDTAWAGIREAIVTAWEGFIQPALQAMGEWITGTLAPAIMAFWQAVIVPAWQAIGAIIQAAWVGFILPVLQGFGEWITGTLGPAIVNFWQGVIVPAWTAISATIGEAWNGTILPALQAFGEWITVSLGPALMEFWQTVVVPAWEGITNVIRGAWEGHILPVFTFLREWVTTFLMPLFTELWQSHVVPAWEGIAAAVQRGWEVMGPAFIQIIEGVGRVVTAITGFLAPAFHFLAPIVSTLANLLGVVLGGAFTIAVQFVGMLVGALIDHLGGAVQGAIQFISGLVTFVAAIFQGDWRAAWEAMKDIAVGAFKFLWHTINVILTVNILGVVRSGLASMLGLFRSGMSGITSLFSAAWNGILSLMRSVWNGIVGVARGGASGLSSIVNGMVNAVLGFFRNMGSGMASIISNAWSVARSTFGGATAAIRTIVSQFVSAVIGFFRNLGTNIASHSSSMMNKAWSLFKTGMSNIKSAVSDGIKGVLTYFRELPGNVVSALGNLGNTLKESGRALLAGFIDGITDGFSRAKGVIEDGLSGLRRLFPFSPAKEGPFSGRGYTTYSGRALSRDFADAIAAEAGYLTDQTGAFMRGADFSATARVSTVPDLTPLSGRDLLLDGTGRLPVALSTQAALGPAALSQHLELIQPAQTMPDRMTIVLDDGTKLTGFVRRVADEGLREHVDGLVQPLRQFAGV